MPGQLLWVTPGESGQARLPSGQRGVRCKRQIEVPPRESRRTGPGSQSHATSPWPRSGGTRNNPFPALSTSASLSLHGLGQGKICVKCCQGFSIHLLWPELEQADSLRSRRFFRGSSATQVAGPELSQRPFVWQAALQLANEPSQGLVRCT